MTWNESKSFLYTSQSLKTLIVKKINGKNHNSHHKYNVYFVCANRYMKWDKTTKNRQQSTNNNLKHLIVILLWEEKPTTTVLKDKQNYDPHHNSSEMMIWAASSKRNVIWTNKNK